MGMGCGEGTDLRADDRRGGGSGAGVCGPRDPLQSPVLFLRQLLPGACIRAAHPPHTPSFHSPPPQTKCYRPTHILRTVATSAPTFLRVLRPLGGPQRAHRRPRNAVLEGAEVEGLAGWAGLESGVVGQGEGGAILLGGLGLGV